MQGTSGAGAIGTQIAAYTATGYSSLEFAHAGGSNFKLGDFGAVVQNANPVNFSVPVQIVDGDGDVSASSNIAITLTAPLVPPVALDLDGDGVEFVSTAAGVSFDYDGDGAPEGTAWVAKDDGLLAIDLNGDGRVNNGGEIVFGGNGMTDLAGLAANYDSNGDGVLSNGDAAYNLFGVWQDANSNGISEAGEFRSLADLGIVSIGLTSDGQSYEAADGEVLVHGTAAFTYASGATGAVADASFAIERQSRDAASSTTMALVSLRTLTGLEVNAPQMPPTLAEAMPASISEAVGLVRTDNPRVKEAEADVDRRRLLPVRCREDHHGRDHRDRHALVPFARARSPTGLPADPRAAEPPDARIDPAPVGRR